MNLKTQINQKLAQEFSLEETVDLIFEDLIDNISKMVLKQQEDEALMAILDRLKLFMGEP